MSASTIIRVLSALLITLGLIFSSAMVFAQQQPGYEPEREYQPGAERYEEPQHQQQQMERAMTGTAPGWTIARSALIGSVLGAAIGTGGYLISGQDWDPLVIAYSAGGGLVVGTTIGIVEAMTQERRQPIASLEWMERDMPQAVQIQLFRTQF